MQNLSSLENLQFDEILLYNIRLHEYLVKVLWIQSSNSWKLYKPKQNWSVQNLAL